MNKKKVFISQPMKDKTDEYIKKEREATLSYLNAKFGEDNYEVIDSFFEGAPHDAKPLWFLSKSLELLATADVAFFCAGWEKARGCRIEHECAVQYGIEVLHAC